jgi:hypothetical protein
MDECRVHCFGKADFFQRRHLAGERVGLRLLDMEGMRAPPVLIVYPSIPPRIH